MARYKHVDTQPKLIPIDLRQQLLPGTFEHALDHLLEHAIDLTGFDARFANDATGAPAYAPAVLLKLVLFGYSRGIVSSRAIARACEEHVVFIALCGDQAPHFTTIARFVSTLGAEIAAVFAAVVAVCDAQGLITREMFAIDGVKLPSNAAKHRSGTRAEFERQATKLEAAAQALLARHRHRDATEATNDAATPPDIPPRLERLERDAAQLRTWLATHPDDRRGPKGGVRKSNRTDNESAKMATGAGVIQGYTGVAAVDAGHQIIVEAQAHGTGSEHELLIPVVEALHPLLGATTLLTADAGYHSDANLLALDTLGVDALIADNALRRRDERFAGQALHHPMVAVLHDKQSPAPRASRIFSPSAFSYDPIARTCACPAGCSLVRNGQHRVIRDTIWDAYRGTERTCGGCSLRAQCITEPDRIAVRSVMFARGKTAPLPLTRSARMRTRIDQPANRARYGRRFAVVEPVFANLRHNKRLARFTLRGRTKVDGQWKLFCLVHNIEKLAHHGYAA